MLLSMFVFFITKTVPMSPMILSSLVGFGVAVDILAVACWAQPLLIGATSYSGAAIFSLSLNTAMWYYCLFARWKASEPIMEHALINPCIPLAGSITLWVMIGMTLLGVAVQYRFAKQDVMDQAEWEDQVV